MNDIVVLERYGSALREHLHRRRDEGPLLQAYDLGRELMEGGAGILDVVRLHADAVADLQPDSRENTQWRRAADGFLAEVLASFEMAYLGFKEANASLWRLNVSLEEQVQQRTRELQDSLGALQAIDAERGRLLARVVSAQEQERRRISDDLHDDTIQVMAAITLRMSILRARVGAGDQPAFDRLEQMVSDAIGRLRRLVFELRPPALDREGLAAAIRSYLHTAMEGGPDYTVDDRLDEQPPVDSRAIAYRIAQEALANVRKHARASRVAVTLEPHRDGVRVTIADDGKGFDVRQLDTSRPGHLGVTAMRERASLAGGSCTIASEPGEGTTVTIWIPQATGGS